MCGVLKCCGLVAYKLNICVYAPLILGPDISVDSAPALQALKCNMYRIRQLLFYFLLGIINAMMNLKQFGPTVFIRVETILPGSDSQWLYLVVGYLC